MTTRRRVTSRGGPALAETSTSRGPGTGHARASQAFGPATSSGLLCLWPSRCESQVLVICGGGRRQLSFRGAVPGIHSSIISKFRCLKARYDRVEGCEAVAVVLPPDVQALPRRIGSTCPSFGHDDPGTRSPTRRDAISPGAQSVNTKIFSDGSYG